MHPAVVRILQADVRAASASDAINRPKVALWRGDNARRQLVNREQVRSHLRVRDFSNLDIGLMPFPQQVRVFRDSRILFSILGSTLTGIIYGEQMTGVVAAAPDMFLDSFFYTLMQAQFIRYSEIRGPITKLSDLYRDSEFTIQLSDLDDALSSLGCRA
jgi:capsular polysaccharide biosynthesis protein